MRINLKVLLLVLLCWTSQATFAHEVHNKGMDWRLKLEKPDLMTFAKNEQVFWTLETNKGKMVFRLYPDVAPMHVTSTIFLTEHGFYDGLRFHRIIPGFMAQGGDPVGNGSGGPGYQYEGEFDPEVRHNKVGLLSMANRGPGTDGSQFFITFVPTPWLDNRHTIFGEIVSGTATLQLMERVGSQDGTPREHIFIEHASIERTTPED